MIKGVSTFEDFADQEEIACIKMITIRYATSTNFGSTDNGAIFHSFTHLLNTEYGLCGEEK